MVGMQPASVLAAGGLAYVRIAFLAMVRAGLRAQRNSRAKIRDQQSPCRRPDAGAARLQCIGRGAAMKVLRILNRMAFGLSSVILLITSIQYFGASLDLLSPPSVPFYSLGGMAIMAALYAAFRATVGTDGKQQCLTDQR